MKMTPTGKINVTVGLSRALPAAVAERAVQRARARASSQHVIVLMTDGENTQNRWSASATSADARTQNVHDNVKATNTKLHTVRVINGDVARLKGCATKPSMYCDVRRADADQIDEVFSSIAQNLANVRISHGTRGAPRVRGCAGLHGCRDANESSRILPIF
jgi:hypothetical protein